MLLFSDPGLYNLGQRRHESDAGAEHTSRPYFSIIGSRYGLSHV
jgi:hypothetical protein